jgi:hypothetical protein
MCPRLIKSSGSLRSESNHNVPSFEIRKEPSVQTPWPLWVQMNEEIAKIYNVVVNRIISNIEGTSLHDVENILRHQYLFPMETINDFIHFIITTDTKDIEFEEIGNVRKPVIFRHPRSRVQIVGQYSIFIPDEKLEVKGRGNK